MCPQDVMHTVYEGLGKLEMAAMIYMFVTNRLYFTLSQLNGWMRTYYWGNDRRPPDITESVTKGTSEKTPHAAGHVHMTAGQVKTFIAHSEMLLTPLLASAGGLDDIVWQCWLAFARAVSFMERPSFSFDDVLQLDRYIYYHQTRFVRIPEYASLWKPKHHFMTHVPLNILLFGPPRGYWCMRFEAMYQILKSIAAGSNYNNLPYRIALYLEVEDGTRLAVRKITRLGLHYCAFA